MLSQGDNCESPSHCHPLRRCTPPPPNSPLRSAAPVGYIDLWIQLLQETESQGAVVQWLHVPSHIGIDGNTNANRLAGLGRRRLPLLRGQVTMSRANNDHQDGSDTEPETWMSQCCGPHPKELGTMGSRSVPPMRQEGGGGGLHTPHVETADTPPPQAQLFSAGVCFELRAMKTMVAGAVGANCGEANLTYCGPTFPPPFQLRPSCQQTACNYTQDRLGYVGQQKQVAKTTHAKHTDTNKEPP